jgi:hypothetical protein
MSPQRNRQDTPLFFSTQGYYRPGKIHELKRWLYTPRDDGKPRVLIITFFVLNSYLLDFVDSIKMVYLFLPIIKRFQSFYFSIEIFQGQKPMQLLYPHSYA